MLVADYDTTEEGYEHDVDEMYPSPGDHEMPMHGLGGISDILGKVANIGTTFANTYYGITGQRPSQQAPRSIPQVPVPAPVSGKYITSTGAVPIAQQSPVVPVLHLRGGIANPRPVSQPSFFERNQMAIIGFGGLALVLLVASLRR